MKTMKMSAMIAAVALLIAGSASAIPYTGTLADLVDSNGSIGIGDKVFSDFDYLATDLTGFDASEIQVTASIVGDVYYLTWGGDMTYFSATPGFTSGDLLLNYTVTASAGLIYMIDQSYTGSGQGQGSIRTLAIDETVQAGNVTVANSHLELGDLSDPFVEAGDDLIVNPPQSVLHVTKDINFGVFVIPRNDEHGFGLVTLSEVRQSFHQTNVADGGLTLAMLGFALTGIALVRRTVRG